MEPVRGLRIGAYEFVERIGEGGMGVVWRARDTALDRDVAIKVLPPALARDPERLARFEREAKAVAALSHPNILAIYGFGDHEGSPYAVMELLSGRTLREELGDGPPAAERTLDIARQVARALAAAHAQGVVHRDLKPENVFIVKGGTAKLLDFGLAAVTETASSADATVTPTRTSLTMPGAVLGTVDYLSPEQVRGAPMDARVDVFAFGTLLHELLSGQRPFRRETTAETMTAILREEPPPLPGAPAALSTIVRRCLAKAPEDRFASGRELSDALESAVTTAPLPLSTIGEARSTVKEANEYFERGLFFMRAQFDLPRAKAMLARALDLDPEFGAARAMSALADLIALHEGFASVGSVVYQAARTIGEVLAKQPDLALARATSGVALLYLGRKAQARDELDAALRLNPRSQPAVMWRMLADRLDGRFEAAEAAARAVLDEHPLFWAGRVILSDLLLDQGRIADAHAELQKVFEMDPTNVGVARAMARVHLYEGDTAGARAMLESISAGPRHPNFRVRLAWALLLACEARPDDALAALDTETLEYAGIGLFAPLEVAEIHALAGRNSDALQWIDRAVRAGDARVEWFRRDAFLSGIREEPRFELITSLRYFS